MRYLKKFNESARTFMTNPKYIRLYCSSRGIGINSEMLKDIKGLLA